MLRRMKTAFSGEFRDAYFQEWVRLVNQMLQFIAEKLKLPAVASLSRIHQSWPCAMYPKNNKTFPANLQQLMEDFKQANGIDCQSRDYQMSPPNCIAVLLHWRTLFNLILLLDMKKTSRVFGISIPPATILGEACMLVVWPRIMLMSSLHHWISHHLLKIDDMHIYTWSWCFNECKWHPGKTLLLNSINPEEEIPLEVIIPCYTFPSMYPHQSNLMKLPPLTQNIQIGFHPKSAAKEFPHLFLQFQKLTKSPQVAAIGEIGLDYTRGHMQLCNPEAVPTIRDVNTSCNVPQQADSNPL